MKYMGCKWHWENIKNINWEGKCHSWHRLVRMKPVIGPEPVIKVTITIDFAFLSLISERGRFMGSNLHLITVFFTFDSFRKNNPWTSSFWILSFAIHQFWSDCSKFNGPTIQMPPSASVSFKLEHFPRFLNYLEYMTKSIFFSSIMTVWPC